MSAAHLPLARKCFSFVSLCTGLAFALPSSAQIAPSGGDPDHLRDAPVARAVRISVPMSIDGRLDEEIWMSAPPISDFTQTIPNEGESVTEHTEIRFLYDDENLYIGAWLWDRGEVLTRLARRDAGVPDADFFVVLLDSYHDHRTAYRFATSPAAMKRDEIVTGDSGSGGGGGFGDTSWDPIWDVRTSTTEEGWFVEMRIPFSQLRYSSEPVQTWGLQVERKIRRHGEDTVWAYTPRRERGGVARFGHLVGIEGIAQGKRLELLPFVGGRAEYTEVARVDGSGFDNPFRSGSDHFVNAGLDLKYRVTSNITLDGTMNPDFGQVEMDPAVINLTAFETRFDERRPFFVEGAEIFRFGEGGGRDSQLLYSRRIGRSPQGAVPSSALYTDMPVATTILSALKLTGKTSNGWSVGAMNAVTNRERATYLSQTGAHESVVVEPLTNYFAGRIRRDLGNGTASVGVIGTAVHRALPDGVLNDRLRSAAYAAGFDARVDLANRTWTIAGEFSPSHIVGSAAAMELTQRSSARYLHRPDAKHLRYDPNATSLSGLFGRVGIAKKAGEWQGGATFTAITPGYEVNDLGFQASADRFDIDSSFGYEQIVPGRRLRRWDVSIQPTANWNLGGERQAMRLGTRGGIQLLSFHSFNWRVARAFESWDDRLTRGGPLARSPGAWSANLGASSDSRRQVQLRANTGYEGDDAGGWQRNGSFNVSVRFRQIYEIQFGPELRQSRSAAQYVSTITDPTAEHSFGRRYVFAPIDQTTLSLQARFNATFTPDLSFELYAQPFLSSGSYGDPMELAAARTFDFNVYGSDIGTRETVEPGRYRIDPDGQGPAPEFLINDLDFNFSSLLGNAVLRWEWRPGSTLFLVWQQARSERITALSGRDAGYRTGEFGLEQSARDLLRIKPDNILLVKVNYWLNP